ncbi:hypothetical protein LSTR_LSTR007575 [Laodelphax striatellus]|uniref:Uncharacterized protein n=1 Tax=Laodelphax striatellus TaxID=195883 RepID=A0A482XSH4_LAOST|nr:hypothetical protein LSTR_LSTR007575 [Laodelphax striatellus]
MYKYIVLAVIFAISFNQIVGQPLVNTVVNVGLPVAGHPVRVLPFPLIFPLPGVVSVSGPGFGVFTSWG